MVGRYGGPEKKMFGRYVSREKKMVGRYGGPEKRRSPRYYKGFKVTLEYEGRTYNIRTINISHHGIQIPKRNPPSIGSHVNLTITMRGETSVFEGIVKRHSRCLHNGIRTTAIGIDIISPDFAEFVQDKILISQHGLVSIHDYAENSHLALSTK